ncbi:MAG TPA: hypothetical protein VMH78_07530 [Thermoplasmata archaeon]|nr:hypothetical protein [Thermoplasmata archaeon]
MDSSARVGASVRTIDVSAAQDEHYRRTLWRRRIAFASGLIVVAFGLGAAAFLVAMALLRPSITYSQRIFDLLFGIFVGGFAVGLARLALRNYRTRGAGEVLLSPTNVIIRRTHGGDLARLWADPDFRMRIIDHRTTRPGNLDGAPCLVAEGDNSVAISGFACDAIVEAARARNLPVSSSVRRTASLLGEDLGRSLVWEIGAPEGWARRIWFGK